MKSGYVYIITNKNNTVLYTGVTSDLQKRMYEHKNKLADGFSKRYNIYKLVYFEEFVDIKTAIEKEKYIKGKTRKYKLDLIKSINPNLEDLGLKFEL